MGMNILGTPELFSSVYVWSGVWQTVGYGSIIYIAALAGVDMEQHEAAVLDGATRFQRVIYLTLPAISGTIVTVFILNLAKVLNLFDPVWVLQNSMVINTSDVLETAGKRPVPAGQAAKAAGARHRAAVRSVHRSRLVQIRHFYPAGCHRQ